MEDFLDDPGIPSVLWGRPTWLNGVAGAEWSRGDLDLPERTGQAHQVGSGQIGRVIERA
jgi:hypothetical protein